MKYSPQHSPQRSRRDLRKLIGATFFITTIALALGACGGSEDESTPAPTSASPFAPRGTAVGTAKVIVTNGGAKPLHFFAGSLEVGEPYFRQGAFGTPLCGGDAFERRAVSTQEVAPAGVYEPTFSGTSVEIDLANNGCLFFQYVAAGRYPARVCAYEAPQASLFVSLKRPSETNMPKPTRCVDFTIEVPIAGQESVTKITLP